MGCESQKESYPSGSGCATHILLSRLISSGSYLDLALILCMVRKDRSSSTDSTDSPRIVQKPNLFVLCVLACFVRPCSPVI